MYKKILKTSPLLIVIVLLVAGWLHRFWLFDSYRLAFYEPTSAIQDLADRSGMSATGKRLFLAAQPVLLLEDEFDIECQFADLGLVLGCYKSADIYILDVTEAQLEPVEPVTAAHEMLHVVYSRLTLNEEQELKNLLDIQFDDIDNKRVIDEIEGYKNDPASDIYNEMHSIFGTEVGTLNPELEEHYRKYFSDRSLVLEESSRYEKVFQELEDQIILIDSKLSALGQKIDQLEIELTVTGNQIEAQRAQLNVYERNNQNELFNALVPSFNSLVSTYNTQLTNYQDAIAEFNKIVEERNKNVAAKNNLIKSLDSNIQSIE